MAKTNSSKITVQLTLVCAIGTNLLYGIIDSLKNTNYPGKPHSLYQIWLFGALGALVFFSSRFLKFVSGDSVSKMPFIAILIFGSAWICLLSYAGLRVSRLMPLDYAGIHVHCQTSEMTSSGAGLSVLLPNKLKDRYQDEIDCESDQNVAAREEDRFLFWQTGMAAGFEPAHIRDYKKPDALGAWVVLFFTTGPLVALEYAIFGIINNTIFIAVAAILIKLKTRRHFWENDSK